MSAVAKRLEEVYQRAKILPFNKHSKMILMSDCHRGQGNTGDNFLANQTLFLAHWIIITSMDLFILSLATATNFGKTGKFVPL